MAQPSLDDLLKAGVHFGHQTRRWNPKMRRFIFAERNGIHIIDLQKTLRQIELAQKLAREVILRGDNVLFVCTKRQLSAIVKEEAGTRQCALRDRAVAGRTPDQLPDRQEADPPAQGSRGGQRDRPATSRTTRRRSSSSWAASGTSWRAI